MAYERTASGGKREKIPKYGTDKYRSSEHITPLHSDLSYLVVYDDWFNMNLYITVSKHLSKLTYRKYSYKTKKASLLRNPQKQALTEVSI